ncbi:MAG: hypothetical protein ACE5E7_07030 [Anaerolineae bacterium]
MIEVDQERPFASKVWVVNGRLHCQIMPQTTGTRQQKVEKDPTICYKASRYAIAQQATRNSLFIVGHMRRGNGECGRH